MKTLATILTTLVILGLLIGAGTITGCSQASSQPPAAAKTYYCPMHPDVVQNSPGKCPKCGMDLTEKN
jgi:Cu(I)/Ag(I) efflux system membrane fusion protein